MPHAGGRNQLNSAVHHAQARPEDGNKRQLASGNHLGFGDGDGGLHLHLAQGEVAGGLIAQQLRDLLDQLPELLGAGVFVPQQGDLVLDQRMIGNKGLN